MATNGTTLEGPAILEQMYPITDEERALCERFFAKQRGVSEELVMDMRRALGLEYTPPVERLCPKCGFRLVRRIGNDATYRCSRCNKKREKERNESRA